MQAVTATNISKLLPVNSSNALQKSERLQQQRRKFDKIPHVLNTLTWRLSGMVQQHTANIKPQQSQVWAGNYGIGSVILIKTGFEKLAQQNGQRRTVYLGKKNEGNEHATLLVTYTKLLINSGKRQNDSIWHWQLSIRERNLQTDGLAHRLSHPWITLQRSKVLRYSTGAVNFQLEGNFAESAT